MMPLRISDHALLRMAQRTGAGVTEDDRAALAQSLVTAAAAASRLGVIEYLIVRVRLAFVVRDGVVVTVLADTTVAQRANALREDR